MDKPIIASNLNIMYAKVFLQILDSSIAENYEVRHVFEDLLKLADKTGVVDMTAESIARRTNVPLEKVVNGLAELLKPDPRSRSKEHDGARIIPVDSRRNWGWIIVNYEHYRSIQDEDARRASWRDAKARARAGLAKKRRKPSNKMPLGPSPCENSAVVALNNGDTQTFESQAAHDL